MARGFEFAARRGWLDAPPLTRDQLASLAVDNVADLTETDRVFGANTRVFAAGIREYLDAGRHDPRHGIGGEAEIEPVAVLRLQ
jgi:hypothetical protein